MEAQWSEQDYPPKTPSVGDVWKNMSEVTIQGIPPGNCAIWDGASWVDAEAQIDEQEGR